MITGKVTPNREAVIEVEVSGPTLPQQEVEAVVDTGFNGYLTFNLRIEACALYQRTDFSRRQYEQR
jgi:predicted aspartyl protease